MMLGLLIGALIGAVAVFARAKVGVLALVACILTVGVVTAAVCSPHPSAFGLLAMAAAQLSYLLVAYAQEYLQERVSRRAMQTAIGQELKVTYEPQAALPRKIIDLVKALDEH
jgi:disulfide bond formation protein DsbB